MAYSDTDSPAARTLDLPAADGPATGQAGGLRDRLVPAVFVGSNILNMVAIVALAPAMALIAEHFGQADLGLLGRLFGQGGGAMVVQLMVTLLGIGIILGGPAVGWLAARIGNRHLLCLALAVYVVTGSSGLLLDAPASFLVARFLLGVSFVGINVAVVSMIGDRYEGEARAKFLGLQGAIVSASGLVTLYLAGQAAGSMGWRGPFTLFLPAILMLALALFAAPRAPAVKRASVAAAVPEGKGDGAGVLRRLWPFYLMLVPFYLAAYMTTVHLSFVLAGDGVTRPQSQGLIMTASMAFNIIGSLSYGALKARTGRRGVFIAILAIFAASDLVIGLWANATGSTVGCWIAGLAGGLMGPFFSNVILDRTQPEERGRALGFMYTTMYIGDFLNPFAITPLRLVIGNHPVFAIVGAGLAVAALAQLFSKRSPVEATA